MVYCPGGTSLSFIPSELVFSIDTSKWRAQACCVLCAIGAPNGGSSKNRRDPLADEFAAVLEFARLAIAFEGGWASDFAAVGWFGFGAVERGTTGSSWPPSVAATVEPDSLMVTISLSPLSRRNAAVLNLRSPWVIVKSVSPGSTVNVSWAGPVTVIVAPRRATWTLGSLMSNSIVVFPIRKKRTTAASAATGAMAVITHRSLPFLAGGTCAARAGESPTIAVSSCDAAESDAKRSAGFLASIFRQTASIRGSRPGRNLPGGVGCRERICPITEANDP